MVHFTLNILLLYPIITSFWDSLQGPVWIPFEMKLSLVPQSKSIFLLFAHPTHYLQLRVQTECLSLPSPCCSSARPLCSSWVTAMLHVSCVQSSSTNLFSQVLRQVPRMRKRCQWYKTCLWTAYTPERRVDTKEALISMHWAPLPLLVELIPITKGIFKAGDRSREEGAEKGPVGLGSRLAGAEARVQVHKRKSWFFKQIYFSGGSDG